MNTRKGSYHGLFSYQIVTNLQNGNCRTYQCHKKYVQTVLSTILS